MTAAPTKLEDELRAGLEGVTPGPWVARSPGDFLGIYAGKIELFAMGLAPAPDWPESETRETLQTAHHIARCSPDNILALLDSISALRTRAETAEKENAALITNCMDLNEAGLEALKQRDDALRDAKFWENLSNGNSASADKWKALAEARREAMEPFGRDAGNWADDVPDNYQPRCTEPGKNTAYFGSETAFTVGDLRRARTLTKEPNNVG